MVRDANDYPSDGIDAGDAISYATNGDMLVLYGVIVVGWAIRTMGTAISAGPRHEVPPGIQLLVGVPLTLLGAIVVGLGFVALAYKVLSDAHSS